ncbi:map kinase kinase [Diplodia corticola]|uniref:Map kinase kinase n=1 Tax=Diplodia corticola TaxID=236234 RepID=A0A1J9QT43_9PEZI|nr:map kinase kinase [Diplodia corticola]OJD32134.1 map kinase kinase [Diplodia corticola]
MDDAPPDMPTTQAHAHPDAQATVTDFLDYTEFYPSDLARSLTLIEKLDKLYCDATDRVHKLTVIYGHLPKLPQAERPDAQQLRKDISKALIDAERFRESAYAEAARLCDNTERHATRLVTIKKKLQALPEPPSRDPTPVPQATPQATRSRKIELERTPRITFNYGEATTRPRPTSTARVQKHRERKRKRAQEAARGIAPGQSVERNLESPQPSSDWDDGASDLDGDIDIDTVSGVKIPKIKGPKQKGNKAGRAPRTPGMGTNVHSSVAGISTSNALAQLTPPPADAKPGSKYAPWHKLTEYEMAVLRKTMKKNAIWQPSDTMIRRELSSKGRGWENYKKAREMAEETGEPFLDESPMDPNKEVLDPGETSFKPLGKEDNNLINRGMKLNEMKKLKREASMREQAARDAQEIEDASRRMAEASAVIKNVFDGPAPTPISLVKDKSKSAKKRKRDSTPDPTKPEPNEGSSQPPDTAPRPSGPKKLKLGPPAPPRPDNAGTPSPTATRPQSSPTAEASTMQVPLAPEGPSSPHAPSAPPTRTQTPILTSPVEAPNPTVPSTTAAGTRSRRTSVAPKASTPLEGGITPAENHARPRSRAGSAIKAASAEPPIKREPRELRELRRGSNVSIPLPTDQPSSGTASAGTPGSGPRLSVRRSKRPAPGTMTKDKKVVIGRRSTAPRKKVRKTEDKADMMQHEAIEDIDPNEPRYCLCGDVSYGAMVACDNDNCEKEWFHLECVGLPNGIKDGETWYCPECRAILHIDAKGNPAGNGKRR